MYKITVDYGDEEHCYICTMFGWDTHNIIRIKNKGNYNYIYIPMYTVRNVSIEELTQSEGERMYVVSKGENK